MSKDNDNNNVDLENTKNAEKNNENNKKESEQTLLIETPNASLPKIKKSVILTYSKYSSLGLKAKEILISDLEEKGSEYLKTNLWNFLQSTIDSKHLLIHFNTKASVAHFMFLRHQVDNWLSEYSNEDLEMQDNKHIVFVVYKSSEDHHRDVDFLGGDWEYQVIENLTDSCYKGNINHLGSSTEDIFQILHNNNPRKFARKMFFKHLSELPLKKHCLDIVRNQMLPVLSHACDKESDNEHWKLVNYFHQRLVKRIDFSALKAWERLVFECEMYGPIEDIVVAAGTKAYSEGLVNVVRRLKRFDVISSLVIVGWLPKVYRKEFFELLVKKIANEFSELE
jgi:hypothetical protein